MIAVASQRRSAAYALAGICATVTPAAVLAQATNFISSDTTLLQPSIPEGFDHGRNMSVLEQERPDYAALGIPVSSFRFFPEIDASVGATNNVFLSSKGRRDGYVDINPIGRLQSDWSRNELELVANTDIQRYFDNAQRNQTSWNATARGRYDIGDNFKLHLELNGARQYESPYSGNVNSSVAVLSSYHTEFGSLRGDYVAGRIRAQVAIDESNFDFASIDFGNGTVQDQTTRNHHVTRIAGQFEYAFTPSISTYSQLSYDKIDYSRPLGPDIPNRDSDGYHVIGGVNFDLSGFLRGSIGVGYVKRAYDAVIYKSVSGVSAEAKVEYFPSDLTTFTLNLRRFLEDSGIFSNVPDFEDSAAVRVDHALLENLLLNLTGQVGHVHYIGLAQNRTNFRISGGAEYKVSRRFGLRGSVSYGKQTAADVTSGQNFNEVRGQIGVYVQR